jgi:hypothetical protein
MLSAEHYALEHRQVQALLDLRQREVSYMTERFSSIATQSSLIGGFVVTALTAVQPGGDENTLLAVKQVFWASSALSLACCVHCILNSTFAAVWGPGLALRGPTGSVSKAYWAMVSERKHIMIAYVLSLLFFVVQTVMGFFILDAKIGISLSSLFATVVMTLGVTFSGTMLYRMSRRMGFSDRENSMGRELEGSVMVDPDQLVERVLNPNRSDSFASEFAYLEMGNGNESDQTMETHLLDKSSYSSYQAKGETKLNKSINQDNSKKIVSLPDNVIKKATTLNKSKASEKQGRQRFVHMGYLEKRGKRLGRWQKRYVRLQGTMLYFFDDLNAYQTYIATPRSQRKKPKSLSLRGYQILVKNISSKKNEREEYCFVLDAMNDGTNKRDRSFRCSSEQDLRGWVESLVAASLVAQ